MADLWAAFWLSCGVVFVAEFTVGSAFLLAELGDKTMVAAIMLASQNGWLGTWLGATAGMLATTALAICSLISAKPCCQRATWGQTWQDVPGQRRWQ
jgi:putative Ca2+/H+ antiporter (TMEM165/GDT1 family)